MKDKVQVAAFLGSMIMESDLELLDGLRRHILSSELLSWGVDPLQTLLNESSLPLWGGQALVGFLGEPSALAAARSRARAIVTLVEDLPLVPGLALVGPDHRAAGELAARYLSGFQPQRLLFLGHSGRAGALARRAGFHAFAQESGIPTEELVLPLARRHDDLREELQSWLLPLRHQQLGIFCTSDSLAARMLGAARGLQMDIPGQVQILGCGNLTVVCELTDLPISSVILPWRQTGQAAGHALEQLLSGQSPAPLRLPPSGIEMRLSSDLLSHPDPDLAAALALIRSRISHPLSVDDICGELSIGRRTLERRFASSLRRSIRAEIDLQRLRRAGELLRGSSWPLSQIARSCGLSGTQALHLLFRRHGLPPPGQCRT